MWIHIQKIKNDGNDQSCKKLKGRLSNLKSQTMTDYILQM